MGRILSAQELFKRLIIRAVADQTESLQEWQDSGGNIVGSVELSGRLDLRERIRVRAGSPAEGKGLTSDANGLGRWEYPVPQYATLAKLGM